MVLKSTANSSALLRLSRLFVTFYVSLFIIFTYNEVLLMYINQSASFLASEFSFTGQLGCKSPYYLPSLLV